MSIPVYFNGANLVLKAPKGQEESVSAIALLRNGGYNVSCWELTDADLEEITRTRRVYVSIASGEVFYPMYVGPASAFVLPPQNKDHLN